MAFRQQATSYADIVIGVFFDMDCEKIPTQTSALLEGFRHSGNAGDLPVTIKALAA